MRYNIAIDGPAGAGKSTIAKRLAKELGAIYVDTGAMYRAMAYYFIQKGVDKDDIDTITKLCKDVEVSISYENGEQQVILNGENITCFTGGCRQYGISYQCLSCSKRKAC